jgi:hypothetical protein
MPQYIEVPILDKYGGKLDLASHISTYIALCSDFIFEDKLLAKIFSRSLKDNVLEWFLSFPNKSIHSFNELIDAL